MADMLSFPLAPYIAVKGAAEAIAFYVEVLGAREIYRLNDKGRIGHAELEFGGSRLMISDEYPDHGALGPLSVGGTPVKLHLYVENVDAVIAKAEKAGAKILRPAADEFYGARSGMIADPFGHEWFILTHKEDVSPEEMQKHLAAFED